VDLSPQKGVLVELCVAEGPEAVREHIRTHVTPQLHTDSTGDAAHVLRLNEYARWRYRLKHNSKSVSHIASIRMISVNRNQTILVTITRTTR